MTPEAKKVMTAEHKRLSHVRRQAVQRSHAHVLLEIHLKELGLDFEPEFRFDEKRKWRFDYFVPPDIAIEIEGGIWIGGRHVRAKGYLNDLQKYREAARQGFRVYRFSTQEVLDGTMREFMELPKFVGTHSLQAVGNQ